MLTLIIVKLIILIVKLQIKSIGLWEILTELSLVFFKMFAWVIVRSYGVIDNCHESADILGLNYILYNFIVIFCLKLPSYI